MSESTAAAAQPEQLEQTVASMGELTFKAGDLVLLLAALPEAERQAALQDRSLLQARVRDEVLRMAVVDMAKQARFDRRAEVAYHVRRAAEQAVADLYLSAAAAPPADFPSPELMRQAYEREREVYMTPEQLRLAQIFIAVPDNATAQQRQALRAEAAALVDELKQQGEDFAVLAQSRSDHKQSALLGGDIGWVGIDKLVAGIAAAVAAFQIDQISEVIELADGLHIVKLTGRRPPLPIPFEQAETAVAANLRRRRLQQSREAILQRLLQETPPLADAEALARAAQLFTEKVQRA